MSRHCAKRFGRSVIVDLLLSRTIPQQANRREHLVIESPKLAKIDEVWIATPRGLLAENYFAIDLVWPLDAALA